MAEKMSGAEKKSRILKLVLASIFGLSLTIFLGKSYEVLLRGIDSNIHAAVALQTTSSGISPSLPMVFEGKTFNDHPFFPFWINGWIMRALGPSAWSARVFTAASSVGCVFATYALGSVLHSAVFGVLAALMLIFTRDFVLTSATMSLDTTMLFFILLSFYFWLKKRPWALGISCGVGLWIKTPLVLLVFPTAVLVLWIQGKLKKEWPGLVQAGAVATVLGGLFWLSVGLRLGQNGVSGWHLVSDYWIRQVWGTAVGGRNLGDPRDWFFFFRTLKTGFLPFLPLLILAGVPIVRGRKWKESSVLIPLTATLIVGTVVTLMKFKHGHYFTPIFPFLALLSAHSVCGFFRKHEDRFYEGVVLFTPILLAILLCCPIPFAPEAFLSLRRFMPYIQSYGNCKDKVLLIRGGEPIGSAHDYRLVIGFYTGHPVEDVDCDGVAKAMQSQTPPWVILSHENYQTCLSPALKSLYPTRLTAGNQVLLSRLIPAEKATDLTPLERELNPSVDCKAPAYIEDMYHRHL